MWTHWLPPNKDSRQLPSNPGFSPYDCRTSSVWFLSPWLSMFACISLPEWRPKHSLPNPIELYQFWKPDSCRSSEEEWPDTMMLRGSPPVVSGTEEDMRSWDVEIWKEEESSSLWILTITYTAATKVSRVDIRCASTVKYWSGIRLGHPKQRRPNQRSKEHHGRRL